jgi:hypothetical protein
MLVQKGSNRVIIFIFLVRLNNILHLQRGWRFVNITESYPCVTWEHCVRKKPTMDFFLVSMSQSEVLGWLGWSGALFCNDIVGRET